MNKGSLFICILKVGKPNKYTNMGTTMYNNELLAGRPVAASTASMELTRTTT